MSRSVRGPSPPALSAPPASNWSRHGAAAAGRTSRSATAAAAASWSRPSSSAIAAAGRAAAAVVELIAARRGRGDGEQRGEALELGDHSGGPGGQSEKSNSITATYKCQLT
jgi:hypothetical protein